MKTENFEPSIKEMARILQDRYDININEMVRETITEAYQYRVSTDPDLDENYNEIF